MKKKSLIINTSRLLLKSFSDCDKDDVIDIFTDSEVCRTYMIPEYKFREEYEKLFNRFLTLSNDLNRFVYGIYLDEKVIGFINDVEIKDDEIELGYVISPKYKNNGYATEVLAASINLLFEIGYHVVKAGAFVENIASIKVMKKCGMSITGEYEEIFYKQELKKAVILKISKGE